MIIRVNLTYLLLYMIKLELKFHVHLISTLSHTLQGSSSSSSSFHALFDKLLYYNQRNAQCQYVIL